FRFWTEREFRDDGEAVARGIGGARRRDSGDVGSRGDRKSTSLHSSHTEIYTLSLHDALPISSASGLKENFGTMVKPLHAGLAARDGVTAAMLARAEIGRAQVCTPVTQRSTLFPYTTLFRSLPLLD